MKELNKNLVPDGNDCFIVTLCKLADVGAAPNLIEWIDGINNGERSVYGDYIPTMNKQKTGMLPFRILKVKLTAHPIIGSLVTAVIGMGGTESVILSDGLTGDLGVIFKPRFRHNDPTKDLITFDFINNYA
jgi:hypothetical protein